MAPRMKPMKAEEVREYARAHGAKEAYNLLLLGGHAVLKGKKGEYEELLKELESTFYWGRKDE